MPHFERSSGGGRPEFMVVHDGSQTPIPEAEQLQVGTGFNDFFDDLKQRFAEGLHHYGPATDLASQDCIYLRRAGDNANDRWGINLEEYTERPDEWNNVPPPERIVKGINLAWYQDDVQSETFRYQLTEEGIVRRIDVRSPRAQRQAERELGLDERRLGFLSLVAMVTKAKNYLIEIRNMVMGSRLERKMGLNDQPIGRQELDGLVSFLSDPSVEIDIRPQ